MGTLVRIALRNVLRNRRRTLITLVAIVVGVGVSLVVRGMLNGVQGGFLESVVLGQIGAVQVHRKGYLDNVLSTPLTLDFVADEALLAKVRAVPGVKAAARRIQFPAMVSVGEETVLFQATAIEPEAERATCPKRWNQFVPGSTIEGDHLLLGKDFALSLGAQRGSEIVLLAPDRDGSLSGELVHGGGELEQQVLGEMKAGLVSLEVAQRLLKMEGRATELAVAIDHLEDAPKVVADLQRALGPEFEVHSWRQIATFLDRDMALQDVMGGVIAGVFLILMLLGVANTMLMSTLERTREVGTMMAVGIRRAQIAQLFLVEALSLGTLGASIGVVLGGGTVLLLGARGLSFASPFGGGVLELHPALHAGYVILIAVVASLGAVVFSLYPALRASRLRPVQALAGQ